MSPTPSVSAQPADMSVNAGGTPVSASGFWRHEGMLFAFIFVVSTVMLIALSSFTIVKSGQDLVRQQYNQARLTYSAAHSLFLNQEMLLDVVGNELLDEFRSTSVPHSSPILDHLLDVNPAIVGFGMAATDGQLLLVSSNLMAPDLPNLRQQRASHSSFLDTLVSEHMVIGRSYLMPVLGEWVVPIRKALRDEQGKVLAVMTAGLRLTGSSHFFNDSIHLHDDNMITVAGAPTYLPFYQSYGRNWSPFSYESALPAEWLNLLDSATVDVQRFSVSANADPADLEFRTDQSIGVALHNPRFNIWVLAMTKKSAFERDCLINLAAYGFIYLVVLGVSWLLISASYRAERNNRHALWYQATHDPLTGLANRSYLVEAIGEWTGQGGAFSVLYVDMDYFKNINDNFGHEFGDKVLIELARRLTSSVPEDALALRQGGDEFLVLLRHDDLAEDAPSRVAQRVLEQLSSVYHIDGLAVEMAVSIGISSFPAHGTGLDELLRCADIAMYEAKKYRNCVREFSHDIQSEHQMQLEVEFQLRNAIANNEFSLVYQPQYLADSTIAGVEALIRWDNPLLGRVSPDRFIPVAEATGLMPCLGEHILELAVRDVESFIRSYGKPFHVSVNISVRQFMAADFVAVLRDILARYRVPHSVITLEITESVFIDDLGYMTTLLQGLRDLGLRISLDDFGTGYSSLSMLARLPVDELKVDKSFVDDITDSDSALLMVQNIIDIGKNLGMTVVAEGVEKARQFQLLRGYGCDLFQGMYFSGPLTAEELRSVLVMESASLSTV